MIVFETTPPSAAEWNALRESVGWKHVAPSQAAERALRNSVHVVCAREAASVVGMSRVVGDGGNAFYIQDVIVHPSHQGRGIGRGLMDRVMAFFETVESDNVMICLLSAKGKEPFYARYGFIERPNEIYGAGMIQFKNPSCMAASAAASGRAAGSCPASELRTVFR